MGCGRLDAAAAVELALSRSAAEWAKPGTSAPAEPCSADGDDAAAWPADKTQTITFHDLPDRTTADGDFRVHATASSGLPVTFAAEQSCRIHNRVVHVTGAGLCVITALQPGNDDYNAAQPVTRVVAVIEAEIPKALPSSGRAGGVVQLRYRTSTWSIVAPSAVVRRNGKAIAHLHSAKTDVEPGSVYSIPWHASGAAAGGTLRFCVTLANRTPGAPKRSYTSCAPIKLDRGTPTRLR